MQPTTSYAARIVRSARCCSRSPTRTIASRDSWSELYASRRYRAYVELLVESQRDPALAKAMQKLLLRQVDIFEIAVDHYFVAAPATGENPRVVFLKMALLLHGIATHAHLAPDPAVVPALLNSWVKEAGTKMRARKGVRTPPPRPPHWDR